MKARLTKFALLAGSAVVATMSFAQEAATQRSGGQDIQQVKIVRPALANQIAPYGYASTGIPERMVDLGGGKKYINVTRLETVQINKDGNSVVWTFDTLGLGSFSLAKVIPWAPGVTVYMEESPLYSGG
ncbi:CzcE family metal-binding protein [Massilia niastensis]|uniref:CzcE family metal-binding protein n=1 Tax=Massilia niastensis TaxID=544911 RepID=UPI000367504A|nr:CzcE family metal-binding protein [Massilia niastensis]